MSYRDRVNAFFLLFAYVYTVVHYLVLPRLLTVRRILKIHYNHDP